MGYFPNSLFFDITAILSATLAYYHANRNEIEADLAEEDAEYWKLAALHSKKV